MYGVGQGLQKGVETAGAFLIPAMRDKYVMDKRQQMFDKELKTNAGIMAGDADAYAKARPVSGPGTGTPGELLAGGPAVPPSAGAILHEGSSDPMPRRAPMTAQPQTVGAGPLAGVEDNTPLTEEQVFEMYRKAAEQRTLNQIRMADEMDVARGWQRSYSSMTNLKRSLGVIQNALKDETGNAAMMLVPQAQDPDQARQVLSGEYMKMLQQYKPIEQEWRLWDGKRNELGIDPNEINSDPGIAQWLNRRQQAQKGGAMARPGARSVVPAPSRGRTR